MTSRLWRMLLALSLAVLTTGVGAEAPPPAQNGRETLERYYQTLSPMKDELQSLVNTLEANRDGYADRKRFKTLSAGREVLRSRITDLRARFDVLSHEFNLVRRDDELARTGAVVQDFLSTRGKPERLFSDIAFIDRMSLFKKESDGLSRKAVQVLNEEEEAYGSALDRERERKQLLWGIPAAGALLAAVILFVWKKASGPKRLDWQAPMR